MGAYSEESGLIQRIVEGDSAALSGSFLASHIGQSDTACRYGGDEFVLVLPNTSQETTKERAELLRTGVKDLKLLVSITISLGVAVFPENGQDSKTLLKSADSALYQAKQNDGDSVIMAK